MRNLFTILFAGLAVVALTASNASADKVEVKGPHICCAQCVNVVGKILGGVDGVSEVNADAKTKTVTFTAKDAVTAKAGINALIKAGFNGQATSDGKEVKIELPAVAKGDKVDSVTVKDVHVCCGACQSAINKLFKDSKVTYENKGPQRTVIVTGGQLYRGSVVDALRKAGFNGSVEK